MTRGDLGTSAEYGDFLGRHGNKSLNFLRSRSLRVWSYFVIMSGIILVKIVCIFVFVCLFKDCSDELSGDLSSQCKSLAIETLRIPLF